MLSDNVIENDIVDHVQNVTNKSWSPMTKGQTQTNYQIITNHTLEILKAKISILSLN